VPDFALAQFAETEENGVTSRSSAILGMVQEGDSHLFPERPEGCFAQKVAVTFLNPLFEPCPIWECCDLS
jgi:hypothetical protein